MKLYSKEGQLLLVQADNLDGETLGDTIDIFYAAGAKNVQMIPTVTKKNRPGYLILINVSNSCVNQVEECIVRELGLSGWHSIDTQHRHTTVSVIQKEFQIHTPKGSYPFTAEAKIIADNWLDIRPEYESCRQLRSFLNETEGLQISLREIRSRLARAFEEDSKDIDF
ncbi:MAG: DUF111 family protein [Clostridiales bacterium]|nr:DUF111 family protein [Clostridiales bacterium]